MRLRNKKSNKAIVKTKDGYYVVMGDSRSAIFSTLDEARHLRNLVYKKNVVDNAK